jgi:glycosyltransferase EpsF
LPACQKPSRILHIIGGMNRGGAEIMLMKLYRSFDRDLFQFDFLYFTDDECHFDSEIEMLGGRIYRLPMSLYYNPLSRTYALYRLLREHPEIKAVHSHTLLSTGLHLFAAKLAGIKLRIAHSHNTATRIGSSIPFLFYEWVSKILIGRYASNFIACGIRARDYLFGSRKNVILLQNAIDIEETYAESVGRKNHFRSELNAAADDLVLIHIARFTEVKNQSLSIDLIRSLVQRNIRCHLVFAGEGPLLDQVREYAKKSGEAKNIHFLGIRDDIPRLLGDADIALLPSYFEGFPVILVESQVVGLPMVVSEQVSDEVDLGLGLVSFASIENGVEPWVDAVIKFRERRQVEDETVRLSVLRNLGFDVEESAKQLEALYLGNI